MTALTHWNPLKSGIGFNPTIGFDDMFRGLATRPLWRELDAAPDMRIDVTEDDKAFHVKAEVPGVDKDAIEVSADGNQVTISAEVKRESKPGNEEGQTELCSERHYGKVCRSFTLPGDFDSAKVDAHYEVGVLALSLPKKADGGTRKIKVG
ncbi:MAG: Hsp20/alpha crystallin family protein [Rhodanobacter sp.]|jgi:HSP20 family protein|nr:Hsp20/alpha crystallin family protein [Rhodanobacter sp.]